MSETMANLDRWVAAHGAGHYIAPDFIETAEHDYSLPPDFGIQQAREEISEFVGVLEQRGRLNNCLEIGLGLFGSTHFLWRQLFHHVGTIESRVDRVMLFRENHRKFFGKHVLGDGRSSFFFGSSHAPTTLRAVRERLLKGRPPLVLLDLLFIDGDHHYEGVLADWLLYHGLVSPGGIVAFHDAVSNISGAGVPRLLGELAAGDVNGTRYDVKKIVHSRACGIGYYVA